MITIFNTEAEAVAYSDKIHNYLLSVRPNYNASKWATPEQSADGSTWSVKTPVEYDDNRWGIPLDLDNELTEAEGTTEPLPDAGGLCTIDKYYQYKGDILKCRQTHNRTIHDPKDTPALFSYFRDNSDQLQWIEGEEVKVKWMRWYHDKQYEVIQAHMTQASWNPVATLGVLWKVYVDPLVISEWQVGVGYIVNQLVTYQGSTYKCLQAHTSQVGWKPPNVPALWQLQH
jgi:hypothetical protein